MASEIKVDTVSEKTSGSGVTIDGLLIKDGGISGDVSLIGTTPTFTIGDAGAEDAALVFDGNAQDFYIALDDSADDLIIGLGSAVGTTPMLSFTEAKAAAFTGAVTMATTLGVTGAVTSAALTASGILKTDDATEATSTTDGSLQTDGGLSVVKDAVFGDDVKLLSDASVIHFGTNSEVTLTHSHDSGLLLKHTATADDKPINLVLQTGETDMAANDVIGKISFQAPDEGTGTDAILISAAIQARAEGDHSSSSNATSLDFMTGASEAAAKKMSLTSAGHLLPASDDAQDLGSGSLQWRDIYTGDLNLNNTRHRKNEVDGTSGSWTIQEGSNDLFLLNRINGKKYKFNLTEVQ